MIRFEEKENGYIPYFMCDNCHKKINANGVYLFKNDITDNKLYFAHQGTCHNILEKRHNAISWHHLGNLILSLDCHYKRNVPEENRRR